MFSSALKSFKSNISGNYEISKQPTASVGVWSVFDAKKKSTGTQASVFVFKRDTLDVSGSGFGARASATSMRKAQEEVIERLKREASSLARLRHPSILQLVEPVEDTRSGGLMFATEPVIASLSGALAQRDKAEGHSNRANSLWDSRAWQNVELDELEIQKGLLQIAKGLEFLHDSAKLVHGNLTPDAIIINAKSDWKISGLSFTGPPDGADGHQSAPQISLSEVLYHDARIPQSVQLNLDYTSPDFVLDSNINCSADIFSLGLVLIACYRSPHESPIETHGNQSTYKKIFSSPSTCPLPSNNYLCKGPLPQELQQVLPRILARRPASRMNAAEFQQSEYFNNILVNTMRFLDGLPAKTVAEKSQFMRGLPRVMPQFPKNVLGKKILSSLLDELKDKELMSVILQNIFQILTLITDRQDALSAKVLPTLREIFLSKTKSEERDAAKEAGLVVFLDNIKFISENCSARQFKEDALPIFQTAMESATHTLVDKALHVLGSILPVLDFSTVKHDLFPIIASTFSKTSSLAIKVRGLEALAILCGATSLKFSTADDLAGLPAEDAPTKNVSSLDKFTMQEKVVPLIKGIKTKEPQVMVAALKVFQQVAKAGDVDFLATEVMPILWNFALGPLLDITQFTAYMETIRALSNKIEREHSKKLQELSSSRGTDSRNIGRSPTTNISTMESHQINGTAATTVDFEKLVLGSKSSEQNDPFAGAMSDGQKLTQNPPSFSWSSPTGSNPVSRTNSSMNVLQAQQPSRSITPDVQMSSFPALQPAAPPTSSLWNSPPASSSSASAWAQPSTMSPPGSRMQAPNYMSQPTMAPVAELSNPWQSPTSPPQGVGTSMTTILPPPSQNRPQSQSQGIQRQAQRANYNINSSQSQSTLTSMNAMQPLQSQTNSSQSQLGQQQQQQQRPAPPHSQQKSGLDKYASLL